MTPLTELWSALEASAPAAALRGSVWVYPLVNAGHILGVCLLIGAMVPLDLKLLGAWPSLPLAPLWRVLTRTAAAGLGLAVLCGFLLFSARATAYVESGWFVGKMMVVAAGAANALLVHIGAGRSAIGTRRWRPTLRLRLAAGVSIAAWTTALVLGRLVGYF